MFETKEETAINNKVTSITLLAGILTILVSGAVAGESPWPMFRHDPQHAGRSQYPAVNNGSLKWEVNIGSSCSSPAIASDGTIYVQGGSSTIYALNPDGTTKWAYAFPFDGNETPAYSSSSPAIDTNGIIYVGLSYNLLYEDGESWVSGKLIALNQDGTLKWQYKSPNPQHYFYHLSPIISSSTIGPDGTIYFGAGGQIYALNPDGTEKWYHDEGYSFDTSSPAIDLYGTIYIGWVNYGNTTQGEVVALNPDGTLKWIYPTKGGVVCSPAIDTDGTIYFSSAGDFNYIDLGFYDAKICALNPNRTLKWSYIINDTYKSTFGTEFTSSPAIDSSGSIYIGSPDANLYAFNSDGTLKWTYQTGDPIYSSPTIASDGTIYVSSSGKLYALSSDGTQKWSYNIGSSRYSPSELVIGSDGTAYVYGGSNLYAFGPEGEQPRSPTNLAQLKSDGLTGIPVGAVTTEPTVVFKANVTDPDGDRVKLQIELRRLDEYDSKFLNEFTKENDFVTSGSEATVTVYGLIDGNYHWQARAVDEKGLASEWLEFGDNDILEVDFAIVADVPSEQPQLKAPWRGTKKITQGNNADPNVENNSHYDGGTWDNTYAIDVALYKADVLAPADGTVFWFDDDPGGFGGKELVLRHIGPTGKEFFTAYLHLSAVAVKSGAVKGGQLVAKSGNTGGVPYHLHFHMWRPKGSEPEWRYDSHTMPIERLVMKPSGVNTVFREYDARKGELDDDIIGWQYFESNNAINSITWNSHSPVDLVITDPDGLIISKQLNEVPGATYLEYDPNEDGDLDDMVYIPNKKMGNYLVEVVPEPNALPTDSYSLQMTTGDGQTMVLAKDVQIQDIPGEPYTFESRLNASDFDNDADVDFYDYATFALRWIGADCHYPDWCEGRDLDYSGGVDFSDFALFAEKWLEGSK